jgi:hypothetical protein
MKPPGVGDHLGALSVSAILRTKQAWQRLGIGKTTFFEKFVQTGRIRLVWITSRACGVIEDELDALIEEMRAERDAKTAAQHDRLNKEVRV